MQSQELQKRQASDPCRPVFHLQPGRLPTGLASSVGQWGSLLERVEKDDGDDEGQADGPEVLHIHLQFHLCVTHYGEERVRNKHSGWYSARSGYIMVFGTMKLQRPVIRGLKLDLCGDMRASKTLVADL